MQKIVLVMGLFTSFYLLAEESNIDALQKVQQKICETQIDENLKSGGKKPLDGAFVAGLVPANEVDATQTCERPQAASNTHYEVVFVAQANIQKSTFETIRAFRGYKFTSTNKVLLEYAANSTQGEYETAQGMADLIKSEYQSDEDRYGALASYAQRLYENYNKSRTPGLNISKYNPNGHKIPSGDLSIQDLAKAALANDSFSGGVCNDISEVIAILAEKMFPDKDVLTINEGIHHATLISDGKHTRIIDNGYEFGMENKLRLFERGVGTDMRISKMDNGKLKEIAVVDTETGQMMEQGFQTGKKLLKTDIDINSVFARFRVVKNKGDKEHSLDIAAGAGDLSKSQMYVVVAKYEYNSAHWRNYAGLGGSAVNFRDDGLTKYQLHFRGGTEFGIIRYASPKLQVNLSSGLQASGMYGIPTPSIMSMRKELNAGVELLGRFTASYTPIPKLNLSAETEARIGVGPGSWGDVTGAWSTGNGDGILGTLSGLRLHLNQISSKAKAEYKVGGPVTAFTEVNYQGSNVGQKLDVLGGVNISGPSGVELIVYTGYATTELPGYLTQHSLLVGANGALVGAGLALKNGMIITTSVTNLAPNKKVVFTGNLSVPLGVPAGKRERVRSHHYE